MYQEKEAFLSGRSKPLSNKRLSSISFVYDEGNACWLLYFSNLLNAPNRCLACTFVVVYSDFNCLSLNKSCKMDATLKKHRSVNCYKIGNFGLICSDIVIVMVDLGGLL